MDLDLGPEAVEYGEQAFRAFDAAGGVSLMQDAMVHLPESRARVEAVLDGLGAWDLDPRSSDSELEGCALLCRAAGAHALPYPLSARLCRPLDLEVDGLVVVAVPRPAAVLAGLGGRWVAVDASGERSMAEPAGPVDPYDGGLVARLELSPLAGDGSQDLALALVLQTWTLLGMMDRALEVTCSYVKEREQFGQPLAAFQGVQFQLTEGAVESAGVDELARHALWSLRCGGRTAVVDAFALHLAALEAAEVIFGVAHQLHGAIGFCDETPVSWLSRGSQLLRRHPFGLSSTREHLVGLIEIDGFAGLFG
jgi:3-oxo-4-pregnene-20-carboxyl-CoA dehydrogenase alpha subunit